MREHNGDDPKFARYGIDKNGIWEKGHSLRMIRSGAAALLIPDAEALTKAYGGVPIYPTYSMSEQVSLDYCLISLIVPLGSCPQPYTSARCQMNETDANFPASCWQRRHCH